MGSDHQWSRMGWRAAVAIAALAGVATGWAGAVIWRWLALGYAVLSFSACLSYRGAKAAAQAGRRRTRASTLHSIDLLGGWPGGLLAQDRLRHKTRKARFQLVFWTTVALNCAVV